MSVKENIGGKAPHSRIKMLEGMLYVGVQISVQENMLEESSMFTRVQTCDCDLFLFPPCQNLAGEW